MDAPNENASVSAADKYKQDLAADQEKKKHAKLLAKWRRFDLGDVVVISGVPCTLTSVNAGKRRLTFTPHSEAPMPTGRAKGSIGLAKT